MKRMLGITVIAVGLMVTGAFLSSLLTNPFANSQSAALPADRSPVLVNTTSGQISILPSTNADGTAAPVVINVGTGTAPMVNSRQQVQRVPVAYRPVVESAYEPEIQPSRVVRSQEPVRVKSNRRSWEKEALIIGGSAAAGAGIGAMAGGKKGAAIGAVSGGVAGLVYDLATRKK
jgi:hypothetical protein